MTYLRINPVLALLLLLTAIAAALPFISYAPNRLVSGEGRHLWQLWPQTIWMLVGVGCAWLTACFVPAKKGSICALILAQFVFVLLVWGAGKAATQLAQNGSALARTSLGSGFWLAAALALLGHPPNLHASAVALVVAYADCHYSAVVAVLRHA